jgi:hypothetical protein
MYNKYHRKKLLITISTYDPYLLVIITREVFGIINIHTDNIIILGNKQFSTREKQELAQAKYTTKPKEKLTLIIPLLFNNYILLLRGTQIILC